MAGSLYRLVTPSYYILFSGDLEVTFYMPSNVSLPNAFVRLRGFNPRLGQWQEITSMGLPLGQTTGNLSVACGVLEFGGQ